MEHRQAHIVIVEWKILTPMKCVCGAEGEMEKTESEHNWRL